MKSDGSRENPLIDGTLYSLNARESIANRTRQIKKRIVKYKGGQNGS